MSDSLPEALSGTGRRLLDGAFWLVRAVFTIGSLLCWMIVARVARYIQTMRGACTMNTNHLKFGALTLLSTTVVGLLWVKNPDPVYTGYTANTILAIGFAIFWVVIWYLAMFGEPEVTD